MSSDQSNENKTKKTLSSGSFNKQLIILFTFLVFFGSVLIIAPKDNGTVAEYIRQSSNSQADNTVLEKVMKLPKLKLSDLKTSVADAKMEIEESNEEALAETEENLSETLSEVETTLKKALKLLLSQNGVSSKQEKEVEDEVIKDLESQVKDRIESEASIIKEDASEDLDTTVTNDMKLNVDIDEIESDVMAMRDYFTKETQEEINYAGKVIQDNIRGIVKSVAKKVINDKLGVQVTDEELNDSELHSKVTTAAEDLEKEERNELKKQRESLLVDAKKANDQIKKILEEFLVKKGLSSSEIKYISKEVSDRFEEMVDENFQSYAEDIKNEVNEVARLELGNLIEEDKMVIDRAKGLGLKMKPFENSSEVDVISKDIKEVRKGLDEYLKDAVSMSVKDLKSDLIKMVGQIEEDVLQENGIKISNAEQQELVAADKLE